jgi:hypothetical protein
MEVIAQAQPSSQLVVTPHPLTRQGQTSVAVLMGNETLWELVEPHGVTDAWVVCIGGVEVPATYWHRVKVKHGQVIECRRRVHGDGLGDIFKLVAIAALVYFTFGTASVYSYSLAGATGLTGMSLTFAQQALFIGGMMLINKLLPNKKADTTTRATPENVPTYSLTGNGNRTRPWEPMSIVFGEPYVVPDLAAQPYTTFEGGEQFLTQIFHAGFNCDSVSSVKVGETLLSSYSDVQMAYDGFTSIANKTMPSSNVDSISGALLDAATAPGDWVVRTTSVNTMRFVVDIEAQLYSVNSGSGAFTEGAVNLDVQYRAVGSSVWIDRVTPANETYIVLVPVYASTTQIVSGRGPSIGTNVVTTSRIVRYDRVATVVPNGKLYLRNASSKNLRVSIPFDVGVGQWEVRLRKTSVNATSTSAVNSVTWAALKSYQADLTSYPGEARLGVIVKASGQLNGAIDTLNWIAKAKSMPYWNGSAWTMATSSANGLSNPGAQILMLARGLYRENLFTYSGDFANAAWAKGNVTVNANVVTAPDGTNTGSKIIENASTNQHLISQFYATTTGVIYTYSVYAKAAEWNVFQIQLGSGGALGTFTLSSGSSSGSNGAISTSIADVGNGWFKCSLTAASNGNGSNYIYKTSASYAGNGTSGMYIWGASLTESSRPLNYVPTTANRIVGSGLHAGLGWDDSRIDIESLKRFMVWCAAKGFTHNYVQQENISIYELMSNIAAVGLGRLDWADGKLGVTFLSDTAPVECVVNMANMKAKSFSVQYPMTLRADELEYGFFDAGSSNTWKSLRVKAPGVTNPSRTARMNNAGVTTEAHAAIMARFQMAANIYMGKSITFEMDLEFLTFGLNTVLALSHDLTQWGYGGRVQSVVNNAGILTLGLDDEIPAGSGSRYIGLRLLGEQQYRIFGVNTFSGTTRSVTLSTAWPSGVAVPGANGQPMDALWIYDFKATPGAKCVVTTIEPSGTTSAKVTVVPLPDEFWPYVLTGAYTPPPNISLLTNKPTASSARVTEVLRKNGLSYIVDLHVTFNTSGPYARAELWGALGTAKVAKIADTIGQDFTLTSALNEAWYFEIRPYSELGLAGTSTNVSYVVQGLSVPPETATGFVAQITGNGVQLKWDESTSLDYSESFVKSGQVWASGIKVTNKSSTTHLLGWLPAGINYFMLKHVDCIGNESVTEATASISISAPNAVAITRSDVQANVFTFAWSDAKNSQPIRSYAYYTGNAGDAFAACVLYGKAGSDGRNDLISFTSSGAKRVWFVAEDVAGNTSTPTFVDIVITMPANFVLSDRYVAVFPGTLVNADVIDGSVYMPITTGTWAQKFAATGWTTLAQQVAAGFPLFFQPGKTTGSYQDVSHDCGKVIANGTISVVVVSTTVVGSITPTVLIEYSANNTTWTAGTTGATEVIANNFRYVRVKYSVTAVGQDDLLAIQSVTVSVKTEPKSETAAMTLVSTDSNGTLYTTTTGLIDITGVTFTPSAATLGGSSNIVKAVPYWDDSVSPPKVWIQAYDSSNARVGGTGTITINGF